MDMALAGWLPVLDLSRARPLPQDNHNPQVLWGLVGAGKPAKGPALASQKQSPPSTAGLMQFSCKSQPGHFLDRPFQVFIRAVCTGALWRHGVDACNGLGQDAVQAAWWSARSFHAAVSPILGAPSKPLPWQALQCLAMISSGVLAPPPPAAAATSMPLHSWPWTHTWPTGSRRLAMSSLVAAVALIAQRANTAAGTASIFLI